MASVANDPNGLKRILFVGADGKRRTIRLGRVTRKLANVFSLQVEKLVAANIVGHPPDDEVTRWVSKLDDVLHAKLANVGLIKPRECSQLGAWLDKYFASRAKELKPTSLLKLGQTIDKLKDFLPDIPIRKITPNQASDWRQWLAGLGLSEATVKVHSGNAKTIFAEAERRLLVTESPFRHLKSGSTRSANNRYITPDETTKILEACPNAKTRLIFGLARLAGLRVVSESHSLNWDDVDWANARLNVRSVKTEHHAGHERRQVPITPQLMELLQDCFDAAEDGEQRLLTTKGGHLRRTFEKIIMRAGVDPWKGMWQTLRSSCEKEWAMTFPQYAVSKWIGHSITISGRHYVNDVPDELFTKAAQNAAQSVAVSARKVSHVESTNPSDSQETALSGTESSRKLEPKGLEPSTSWLQTRRSPN